MKSNRVLFSVLFCIGAALIVSLFLVFIPSESRTGVKWMDLAIILLIFGGAWGKYSLFYPLLGRFSARIPVLSAYWISFSIYTAVALGAMLLFGLMDVELQKQALLQGIILFCFVVVLAVGVGASNYITNESIRLNDSGDGIRAIQMRVALIGAMFATLPTPHSILRMEAVSILDNLNYVGGCSNPSARSVEAEIID